MDGDLRTLQELAALDRRLVQAVKGIKLLSLVSWPIKVQTKFLELHHKGKTRLPDVEYPRLDFTAGAAGSYFIVVSSTFGAEGDYGLTVTPLLGAAPEGWLI